MKGKIKLIELALVVALSINILGGIAVQSDAVGAWWGVMFPAVSLPAESDGAKPALKSTVTKNEHRYVLKFKSKELWQDFKAQINDGQ